MNARKRLNSANFLGSIVLAGMAGALFQSWQVFFVAAAALLVCSLYDGDIRLQGRR